MVNLCCREYYSRLRGFLKDLEISPECAHTAAAPPSNVVQRHQRRSSSKSSSSGSVASSRKKVDDEQQGTMAGERNREVGQQGKARLGGPDGEDARAAGAAPPAAVRPPPGASTAVTNAGSNSREHESKPGPRSSSVDQNLEERHPSLRLDTLDRSSSEWGNDGELKAELEEVDVAAGSADAGDDGDTAVDDAVRHGGGEVLGTATMSPQSPPGRN